jgi:hypothetical protein
MRKSKLSIILGSILTVSSFASYVEMFRSHPQERPAPLIELQEKRSLLQGEFDKLTNDYELDRMNTEEWRRKTTELNLEFDILNSNEEAYYKTPQYLQFKRNVHKTIGFGSLGVILTVAAYYTFNPSSKKE